MFWCFLLSSEYIGSVALAAFEKENYVITDSAGEFSVLHEDDVSGSKSVSEACVGAGMCAHM